MKKSDLPNLTQQPVLYVDATPDDDYPLRILQAYRDNCNSFWEVHGLEENEKLIYDMMNKVQKQRAKILDKAIQKLISV